MHIIPKLIIATAVVAATTAQAKVELRSNDGKMFVQGELISFDGVNLTVRSGIGDLTLPASEFHCTGEECPVMEVLDQRIRISGSDILLQQVLPLALANHSASQNDTLNTVLSGDDGTVFQINNSKDQLVATIESVVRHPSEAFQDLLEGRADIVMTSRRITDAEIDAFIAAGLGDLSRSSRETIIAQDGLVAVTSPDNPVQSLSLSQIEGIFSGRIINWRDVGGIDMPITVIAPADGTGAADFFFNAVLDPEFSDFGRGIQRVASLSEISDMVAADAGAIGLTSSGTVAGAKPMSIGSSCGIVSVSDAFSIKTEDYPLTRRLYVYTTSRTIPPIASTIVNLIQGAESDDIVTDAGLVNLAISTRDLNEQGNRLAYAIADPSQYGEINNLRRFTSEVLNAERLSTTFRFGTGSSQLDNKSLEDALRMAELLRSPAYQGREILVIGFTDAIGRSDVNTSLSVRRAQQVVDEIVRASGGTLNATNIGAFGYGASTPVACNDTVESRELNRHVEVWVR